MMKKLLVMIAVGLAMPAHAAQTITIKLNANISGNESYEDPWTGESIVTPADFIGVMTFTGTWGVGFNSWSAPCGYEDCLRAHFIDNMLVLQGGEERLPCRCYETITLTFDQPFTGQSWKWMRTHFVSGSYEFWSSSHGASTRLGGFLTPWVPEPTSWVLMIAGFGLAGAALRARGRASLA